MPTRLTTSWSLFPPRIREVQFDEKHFFVAKEQKNCDPNDDHKGDWWDHVAYDPEHRLVLAVVPGARTLESAEELVAEVKERLDGRSPDLATSDEYAAYASALEAVYAEPVEAPATPTRRRHDGPRRDPPTRAIPRPLRTDATSRADSSAPGSRPPPGPPTPGDATRHRPDARR